MYPMRKIRSSEITPEHVYLARRRVLKFGAMALGSAALSVVQTACGGQLGQTMGNPSVPATDAPTTPASNSNDVTSTAMPAPTTAVLRDDLGDPANSFTDITTYNNFYEFTEDKEGVAARAQNFLPNTWSLTVGGLVNKPTTFDLDDLRNKFGTEERIYRLRCVEGWSMVIPWDGFVLSKLLKEVEPKAEAKYVRFESLADSKIMPNIASPFYPWPYTEGLRLDEAMNDLTLMATGLYGKPLPGQNGAPVRLAVPWKYGFKSIKSIVKIDLVADQPSTLWNTLNAPEYGFYSNVNPNRAHPRWSQASERRIGESGRRATLMFNGYDKQVTSVYAGMDLIQNY
jgi:sulfoxide reductase catalytic subunit YedY